MAARAARRHGLTLTDELLGISTHNDPLTERQARIYMKYPPTRRGAGAVLRERAKRRQGPLNRRARGEAHDQGDRGTWLTAPDGN